jgi:hypothetical protein
MAASKIKRVALHLRVSTGEQTTENQRRELSAAAGRHGWDVVEVFEDAGFSSAKGRDQRPGLDRLLKAAARKEIDIVVGGSPRPLGPLRLRTLPHACRARPTTAVPGVPMGGSVLVLTGGAAVPLFNGATPHNGFMVQSNIEGGGPPCWVNDNRPGQNEPPKWVSRREWRRILHHVRYASGIQADRAGQHRVRRRPRRINVFRS